MLPPVPLAVAAPAAVAAAAYVNAKAHIWYDLKLLRCLAPMALSMLWRERTGRLNLFYDLEGYANSAKTAHLPFLLFEDQRWTFKQGFQETLKYGTWFAQKLGVKKGDIVAMDFPNSDKFIFVWLGLWSIGAKPAFINYNLAGPALVHCIKAAGTGLVLVDVSVADVVDDYVRNELASTRLEIFTDERKQEVLATTPIRLPDEARTDEGIHSMSNLIYTSGTTGLPKAAVVSWGKIHAAGGFSARLVGSRPGEIFYTVSWPSYLSLFSLPLVADGSGFPVYAFVPLFGRHSLCVECAFERYHHCAGRKVFDTHVLGRGSQI